MKSMHNCQKTTVSDSTAGLESDASPELKKARCSNIIIVSLWSPICIAHQENFQNNANSSDGTSSPAPKQQSNDYQDNISDT